MMYYYCWEFESLICNNINSDHTLFIEVRTCFCFVDWNFAIVHESVCYESFILMCSDSEDKHLLRVLFLHQTCLNRVSLIYKSNGSGIIKTSKYSCCCIIFS